MAPLTWADDVGRRSGLSRLSARARQTAQGNITGSAPPSDILGSKDWIASFASSFKWRVSLSAWLFSYVRSILVSLHSLLTFCLRQKNVQNLAPMHCSKARTPRTDNSDNNAAWLRNLRANDRICGSWSYITNDRANRSFDE